MTTSSTSPHSSADRGSPLLGEVDVAQVAVRLDQVRHRIEAAGGDLDSVKIVAVTKGFDLSAVRAALASGICDLGENYAVEMLEKREALTREGVGGGLTSPISSDSTARWHYLGAIQRNKVRRLAPFVDCWQGVARAVEGQEIAKYSPGAAVLVEVMLPSLSHNSAGNGPGVSGRNGCLADQVPQLVEALVAQGLDVQGLMVVGPRIFDDARRSFAMVSDLADRLGLSERSMGMSEDLEIAVEEGSTMVRIGRALFGDRPRR